MNKRVLGNDYENIAKDYLEKNGILILEKNFRCRIGEIDLIGKDKEDVVFFEVKYRRSAGMGLPAEAVTEKKQLTICRVADFYRVGMKFPADTSFRFDVISILSGELTWIKNAFPYHRYYR